MTTSQPDVHSSLSDTPQTLKRRGLLAAGAAFVADTRSESNLLMSINLAPLVGGPSSAACHSWAV
jgi:hypothetical protein